MQIVASDIGKAVKEVVLSESVEHFPVLAQLQDSGRCRFLEPVQATLRVVRTDAVIEVSGTVAVVLALPCRRCLEETRCAVCGDIHQSYVEHLPRVTGEDGEELELSADEMGLVLYDGEMIDLVAEVEQQVLLLMPDTVLCSEGCRGLCPQCGANLNHESCTCADKVTSLQFAALRDFKVEKK